MEDDVLDTMSDEEFEAAYAKQIAEFSKEQEDTGDQTDTQEDSNDDNIDADDAEQSTEDNSDDAADENSDQDTTEEDAEDDQSNDSDDGDTSKEPEEEQSEDGKDEAEAEVDLHDFKANGRELKVTLDELKILASKGMNYTEKMQRYAKHKTKISALDEANISDDELNLAINVLRGDNKKEAIAQLLKTVNINPDDLVFADDKPLDYTPKQYGRSATQLALDEVIEDISKDQEYKTTEHVLLNGMDDESKKFFADNPSQIKVLHEDVKAGRYADIANEAYKLMQLDQGPAKAFVDYYILAGNNLLQKMQIAKQREGEAKIKADAEKARIEAAKIAKAKQDALKAQDAKKKAAGITKTNTAKNNAPKDYLEEDIASMDDSDFLKAYERITSR